MYSGRAWVHVCACVHRYCWSWQWADNSIAYYTIFNAESLVFPACAAFPAGDVNYMKLGECSVASEAHYLCELDKIQPRTQQLYAQERAIKLATVSPEISITFSTVRCPAGHITHSFLACDVQSSCWATQYDSADGFWTVPSFTACPAPLTSLPPSSACASGHERVPYTLVCDFRADCFDGSDESFCEFPGYGLGRDGDGGILDVKCACGWVC